MGEYEINGQTINETNEKEININFETNLICFVIFNNNDVDASYSIEIHSKNSDDHDSSDFTIDSTISEEMSETSEIVHTESMSEIINPTETSDIVHSTIASDIINQTEKSDIVNTLSESDIINPTETRKIAHTDALSYSYNNDSDTDNNSKKKKKIGLLLL